MWYHSVQSGQSRCPALHTPSPGSPHALARTSRASSTALLLRATCSTTAAAAALHSLPPLRRAWSRAAVRTGGGQPELGQHREGWPGWLRAALARSPGPREQMAAAVLSAEEALHEFD